MPQATLITTTVLTCLVLVVGCRDRPVEVPSTTRHAIERPTRIWVPGATLNKDKREPASAPKPTVPSGIVDAKLFDVETVMRHQGALGITPEQKAAVLRELDAAQTEFNHLEWELNGGKEKLATALEGDRVDEKAAMEAGQRVTELESKLKLAHLQLLIRVKNQLTSEQQKRLRGMKPGCD